MQLDYLFFSLFIGLCGLAIALLSSVLGIGGGVFSVPLLYFAGKQTIPFTNLGLMSISGSLIMALMFSISASIKNAKNKFISYKVANIILSGSILTAIGTTFFAIKIETIYLMNFFAMFLIVNGFWGIAKIFLKSIKNLSPDESMGAPEKTEISRAELVLNPVKILLIFLCGCLVGFLSSITGLGGGIIIVPLLLNFIKLRPHVAVATSTYCIIFIALSGSMGYYLQSQRIVLDMPEPHIGFLYLPILIPLLMGGLTGGYLGSIFAKKVSSKYLNILLAALQLIIAIKILFF